MSAAPARRAVSLRSAGMVLAPLLLSRALWLGISLAVAGRAGTGANVLEGVHSRLVIWDTRNYLDIVAAGYPAHLDYHDAFLPGLPALIRAVSLLTVDPVVAGLVVTLVAEGIGLWYVARLVSAERDRGAAAFSVWLLALAPTAVFFIVPYTESPFLAAAAASLFYARQGRWRAAALCGALAGCFRVTALALVPALFIEMLQRGAGRSLPWVLLVPVPLAAFSVYLGLHAHDLFGVTDALHLPSFGLSSAPPWDGFATTWNTLVSAGDGETRSIFAREVAFGLLGLLICVGMLVSPRIPMSLAAYCIAAWLLAVSLTFWRSEPRYDLALFPVVLLVSDLTARVRSARPVLAVASGVLMCAGMAVYAQGRWLG